MNTKEFAEHIGVSQPRVSKYIKLGVLKKSVIKKGGRYDINAKEGVAELQRNLDQGRKVKAKIGLKQKEKSTIQKADIQRPPGIDFNTARALNEQYKAALKKLEYDEKTERLIEVDEIKKAWLRHVGAVKTKLLGIPAKLTPIVREIAEDAEISEIILQAIDAEIEGALTELSRSKI